jgi:hypothetical protein
MAGNEACLCRIANDDAFARRWLVEGKLASLADALIAEDLDQIPIILRPLHEHNRAWFWWGEPAWDCARHVVSPRWTGAEAYRRVFRTIVAYLRHERGLTNLLVAYAPNRARGIARDATYLRGYPGDEFVDVLGLDFYYDGWPAPALQSEVLIGALRTVTRLARARGKVAALTEVGDFRLASEEVPRAWFTGHLGPALRASGVDLAYAMTWENSRDRPKEFYVPYGDHAAVADFVGFASDPSIALLGDATPPDRVAADAAPVCGGCAADPDGDGWGWEDARSCRVASWCEPASDRFPVCRGCGVDPDGDGWGWEDGRSCVVLPTCR